MGGGGGGEREKERERERMSEREAGGERVLFIIYYIFYSQASCYGSCGLEVGILIRHSPTHKCWMRC